MKPKLEDINKIQYKPCDCHHGKSIPRISVVYNLKSYRRMGKAYYSSPIGYYTLGKIWFIHCAWCGKTLYKAEEAHEFSID